MLKTGAKSEMLVARLAQLYVHLPSPKIENILRKLRVLSRFLGEMGCGRKRNASNIRYDISILRTLLFWDDGNNGMGNKTGICIIQVYTFSGRIDVNVFGLDFIIRSSILRM